MDRRRYLDPKRFKNFAAYLMFVGAAGSPVADSPTTPVAATAPPKLAAPPAAPVPPRPIVPPATQPAPKPLSPEDAAREAFKTGVAAYQQKKFAAAVAAFSLVPETGDYLSLYKHWFLGQSYMELGKFEQAEPEYAKVIKGQASTELKYQAQFALADSALKQKKYIEASLKLQPLEKKWRHSYRYPEVLYRLMISDIKLGRNGSACKRARKLYTKYPAHPTVISWGSDLPSVEIDGKKLLCNTQKDDLSERIRSLQWAGESEKAHKELTDLLAKATDADRLRLDLLMAEFLVHEGSVDDALNLLVRYYPQQKSNIPYLLLLGRAAARSGEYQTAVGAYERAYTLSPGTRQGREALFQAAYLSYQFQDYDGAVRKFQQFVKRNPRSGLSRDAQWHLAWLQYLRNDYRGALEKFAQVAKVASRRRHKNDNLQERLLYWTAMSHIRLNEWNDASTALNTIISRNPYSYYGLAAQARLAQIKPKIDETKPRVLSTLQLAPMDGGAGDTPVPPAQASEEQESEEDIGTATDYSADDDSDDKIEASDFKDPKLRARIDVAQKLIELGLPELARWELLEVEKHTRNSQYLRMLISAYEGIASYNRSASIAELDFVKDRESGGLDGSRSLWTAMFPQAFRSNVMSAAKRYAVPPEWIWAIMRTESMYKTDVISPVGAKGLMQLMPLTARNLYKVAGEREPDGFDMLSPETSIRLGGQYLARLMQKFNGQLALVAAAYNAGPHRVESWLVSFGHLETDEFVEHIPFLETRNYAKKVIRTYALYRRLYSKDGKAQEFLAKALGVPIPTRAATRESWDTL